MIVRRLRDKYARGEPITIKNFVIDTIIIIIIITIIIMIIIVIIKSLCEENLINNST